ncbi:hypothetical protein JTE90_020661 [Oedothorax gibbosus]|uniref:Uncharacterized protein n=1 Tax=Oedothorax gibbosus TaxID=931172 RepID=A0AAV6UTW0_9ARAC|nr:hypothetical protein JTE90_020661 [Oedothorax gibbosus]
MNSISLGTNQFNFKLNTEIIETKIPNGDFTMGNLAATQEMQEIIPGLFLGPFSAASKANLGALLKAGITHIVCVRQEVEASFIHPTFPDKFKYIVINLGDSLTSNIIPILPQVKCFIDNCFKLGGKVLVHGNSGISRSATLVIAYVMETKVLPYKDAFLLVQNKRNCINPSDVFMQQLKEYEPIYKALRTHLSGHSSKVTDRIKRRYSEVDGVLPTNNRMDICDDV